MEWRGGGLVASIFGLRLVYANLSLWEPHSYFWLKPAFSLDPHPQLEHQTQVDYQQHVWSFYRLAPGCQGTISFVASAGLKSRNKLVHPPCLIAP